MTVCLGFHAGDAHAACYLMKWIRRLGGVSNHRLVLVADAGVDWKDALPVYEQAINAFGSVTCIDNGISVSGWPIGPNSLFFTAARYVESKKLGAWLWLEPDAIPMRPNWLDVIAEEYQSCGKPFMGCIIENTVPGSAPVERYLNGVAVYPQNALQQGDITTSPQAWDIASAPRVVPKSHHTPLIQVFWGEKDLAPTFVPEDRDLSACGRNVRKPSWVSPGAVLFHRNPDQSLAKLLWKRDYAGSIPQEPFVVVLPFHNGDAPAALKNLQWMARIQNGSSPKYGCVLSYEKGTIGPFIVQMQSAARQVFRDVKECTYPKSPVHRWPAGPNWAFRHACRYMEDAGVPWLWMESDMIPLTPDWLDQLQVEYGHCGRPVMGAVVPGLGHTQGTAVYPNDLLKLVPEMASVPDQVAFDSWKGRKVASITHDSRRLMAHVWGIEKGQPHPFLGSPPHFSSPANVRDWIPRGSVTFHRCKDGSLIDRLSEMYKKP